MDFKPIHFKPAYGTHVFSNFPGSEKYSFYKLYKFTEIGPEGTHGIGKWIKTDINRLRDSSSYTLHKGRATYTYNVPRPSVLDLEDVKKIPRSGLVMRVVGSNSGEEDTIDPYDAGTAPIMNNMDYENTGRNLDLRTTQIQAKAFPSPKSSITSVLPEDDSRVDDDMSISKKSSVGITTVMSDLDIGHVMKMKGVDTTQPMEEDIAPNVEIGPNTQVDRQKRLRSLYDDTEIVKPTKKSKAKKEPMEKPVPKKSRK